MSSSSQVYASSPAIKNYIDSEFRGVEATSVGSEDVLLKQAHCLACPLLGKKQVLLKRRRTVAFW